MEKTQQHAVIKNSNKGHRKRLKERYLNSPSRTFLDYEILEMLLYSCYLRRDTKLIAKNLLNKFGNLQNLFTTDGITLMQSGLINNQLRFQIKLLQDLFSRMHLPLDKNLNILSNWRAVLSYCMFTMGNLKSEIFRILYLNKKNILLQDEVMQQGTVDRVVVYPREIAKQAIAYGASAIILVHNHPSGEAKPSKEDIEITLLIKKALQVLNISIHDHIIISSEEHFSFKSNGLI